MVSRLSTNWAFSEVLVQRTSCVSIDYAIVDTTVIIVYWQQKRADHGHCSTIACRQYIAIRKQEGVHEEQEPAECLLADWELSEPRKKYCHSLHNKEV